MRLLLSLVLLITACAGRSTPAEDPPVEPAPLIDAGPAGHIVPGDDGRYRNSCDDCPPGYGCCYGGVCCTQSCMKLDEQGTCPKLP